MSLLVSSIVRVDSPAAKRRRVSQSPETKDKIAKSRALTMEAKRLRKLIESDVITNIDASPVRVLKANGGKFISGSGMKEAALRKDRKSNLRKIKNLTSKVSDLEIQVFERKISRLCLS